MPTSPLHPQVVALTMQRFQSGAESVLNFRTLLPEHAIANVRIRELSLWLHVPLNAPLGLNWQDGGETPKRVPIAAPQQALQGTLEVLCDPPQAVPPLYYRFKAEVAPATSASDVLLIQLWFEPFSDKFVPPSERVELVAISEDEHLAMRADWEIEAQAGVERAEVPHPETPTLPPAPLSLTPPAPPCVVPAPFVPASVLGKDLETAVAYAAPAPAGLTEASAHDLDDGVRESAPAALPILPAAPAAPASSALAKPFALSPLVAPEHHPHDIDAPALREQFEALNKVDPTRLQRIAHALPAAQQAMFEAMGLAAGKKFVHLSTVATPSDDIWFIGDCHGDLLALEASLACIRDISGDKACLVFLGDLVDRKGRALPLVMRVFELLVERPERTWILAGNHDVSVRFHPDNAAAPFSSSVDPAEFPDELNGLVREGLEEAREFGQAFVEFFQAAPRAILFAEGTLATHGGFPHVDTHAHIAAEGVDALNDDGRCLSDFTWNRIADTKRKLTYRATPIQEFGWENFFAFCQVLQHLTPQGLLLNRLVRGHDHIPGECRLKVHGGGWGHRAITINNMCTAAGEHRMLGPEVRQPGLVRLQPDGVWDTYSVKIPDALVKEIYREPSA